jgi:predicted enzyme related to lactoylglutathione lyase
MVPHGHFSWNELQTRDVEKAKAFYNKTLGWIYESMPGSGATYWIAMAGDKPAAGIIDISAPMFEGVPAGWFGYIEVDNVDKRLEKVEAAGGVIIRPAWTVPDVGRIAIVKDAIGAVHGWMTSVRR